MDKIHNVFLLGKSGELMVLLSRLVFFILILYLRHGVLIAHSSCAPWYAAASRSLD